MINILCNAVPYKMKNINLKYYYNQTIITIIVFCYVFSFTIYGPLNSSIFIGLIGAYHLLFPSYRHRFNLIIRSRYSVSTFKILFWLFLLSLLFPAIHLSFDYYFSKIIFLLFIQYLIGCIIWSFISSKYEFNSSVDLSKAIIWSFVIQSIIQCIVSFTPSFLPIIYHFNNAQSLNENYTQLFATGVRGVAMANGTGFSLSLGYGIAFIVYINYLLNTRKNFFKIILGLLIIVGIFFAGRSGFIGVLIGGVYYIFSPNGGPFIKKTKFLAKTLLYNIFIVIILYIIFSDFINHIIDNVLPFAFEPIYNFINGGKFETASTNELAEMWDTPVTLNEILIGAGRYFNEDGITYYKTTDIGLFKNIFFWGGIGYFFTVIFQYVQLYPLRYKNISCDNRLFFLAIFIFLFSLDFKAIALALNKTAYSIIILIVFNYETYIVHHSVSSFKFRSGCKL